MGSLRAQVKIGDNYEDVSPYALLELESKDKALLLPRMSNAERDAAFDQGAPIGIMIFNTDAQMVQFYCFEEDKITGRLSDHKVWQDVEDRQIYIDAPPAQPDMGDLHYDSAQNQLLIWDAGDNAWLPIGGAGIGGGLNEVIRSAGPPSSTNAPTDPKNNPPGMLYADTTSGRLYMAIDSDNDGIANRWSPLAGSGGGGGGGSVGPQGSSGPQGPQGLQGPQGPQGPAGSGVVSGTGAPGTLTASPGTVYVDQSTGTLYIRTAANTWVQGAGGNDNLGNHTLTQNLDLAGFSVEDSSGNTGAVGQILVRTASGTLWQTSSAVTSMTADNGLTLTPTNQVELGGSLTQSTTLATSAANTLAITGMQSTTATATHRFVVADNSTGVLRTMTLSSDLQGAEVVYTATANQKVFSTPLSIANLQKFKLNVYRNGVRIDYTKNSNTAIEVVLDAVLPGCHVGDEIRIVQYN